VIFWEIIWRTRDTLPDRSAALFSGFGITALYYFAGALVFPDDLERRSTLDDYFMEEKAKVIGAILIAVALSFALRPAVMGRAGWSEVPWYAWTSLAIIYVAAPITMLTKRRELAIACLALVSGCTMKTGSATSGRLPVMGSSPARLKRHRSSSFAKARRIRSYALSHLSCLSLFCAFASR